MKVNFEILKANLELVKTISVLIIAVCSILLVIQGYGGGTQDVYVTGGDVDADVSGSVYVRGGEVEAFITGGEVDVANTVDVYERNFMMYP